MGPVFETVIIRKYDLSNKPILQIYAMANVKISHYWGSRIVCKPVLIKPKLVQISLPRYILVLCVFTLTYSCWEVQLQWATKLTTRPL